MSKLVFLVFFTTGLIHAQFGFGFGVGVKGGWPFTDVVKAESVGGIPAPSLSTSDSYIVGPVAELRLPLGFAAEVDGLYRAAQYQVTSGLATSTLDANSWEIPYLAKWRFPIPLLKPFLVGGGAYRTFTDLPPAVAVGHNGFVGGAGLELRIARLRLSGEVRYIRWDNPSSSGPIRASANQGEVLLGIMF